jgi:hypothetical protein
MMHIRMTTLTDRPSSAILNAVGTVVDTKLLLYIEISVLPQ